MSQLPIAGLEIQDMPNRQSQKTQKPPSYTKGDSVEIRLQHTPYSADEPPEFTWTPAVILGEPITTQDGRQRIPAQTPNGIQYALLPANIRPLNGK